MWHRSVVCRVLVTATLLCIAPSLPYATPTPGCLDYLEYLHWSNSVETPGLSQAIALGGGFAYVANGSDDGDGGSISILDMTIPRAPQIQSTLATPGSALDIGVAGGLVCVADGPEGLTIVDASDPAHPSVVGRLANVGFVHCVAVSGSVALIGSDQLYAVDLSSPTSPEILGQCEAPGSSRIVFDGTLAYVSCDYQGFRIIDFADPHQLGLIGRFDVACQEASLAVSLPYVYVTGRTYGFGVIDVSDPSLPAQIGWSPVPEDGIAVEVRGGRAYVADGQRLSVIDIGDPTAPALLGQLPIPEFPHAVTLAEEYAFVPSGYAGVQIVNIAHDWPAEPVGGLAPLGHTEDVQASGRFAYTAEGSAGLAVVDLVDPAHPVVVGNASLPNGNAARMVAVEGVRACVIDSQPQLHVFDVSEPDAPVCLSSIPLPQYASALVMAGGWAFVPCGGNGLVMIDTGDAHPEQAMWIYDTPGWASDVAVQGQLAYVVDHAYLLVLDVSDPSSPQLLGQSDQSADEISVEGNRACLSNGYGSLVLMDVSDPTDPVQIAECDISSYTLTVALSWPYVYSSNEEGGLVIHRVDGAAGFEFAGSCELPRNAGTIAREGDRLLVPLWDCGLHVYSPQCGDAAMLTEVPRRDAAVALRAPNPFIAPAVVRLALGRATHVRLAVFDASGRHVATLANGRFEAGEAEIRWDGRDDRGTALQQGVYFVSCRTENGESARKLTLVR
jgi:hypothetical protein